MTKRHARNFPNHEEAENRAVGGGGKGRMEGKEGKEGKGGEEAGKKCGWVLRVRRAR